MAYIDVDTVKTLLGITVSTYDDTIEALIPEVESTAKRITKNRFTMQVKGDILIANTGSKTPVFVPSTISSGSMLVYDMGNYVDLSLDDCLSPGQVINGSGVTSGAYIQDIYSYDGSIIDGVTYDAPIFTITGTVTAANDVTLITGLPVGLKSTIAHGIWWLIGQRTQSTNDTAWTSRSVGPLSITRSAADNAIDGQYGMPAWFIKSFPRFH